MPRKAPKPARTSRRQFTEEFRREAVQMLLDGHTAASVAERLGLDDPTLLYKWKARQLEQAGPAASSLEDRVKHFEAELLRVTRERDVLKKALAIFSRNE